MSATEIIEQIKTLPHEEQRQVFAFVRDAETPREPASVRYADHKSFREAADRVFEKHDELFRRLAE